MVDSPANPDPAGGPAVGAQPYERSAKRPTGVMVLSVLAAIGAVLYALGGLALLLGGAAIMGLGVEGGIFGGLAAVGGVLLLVLAAFNAAVAFGLWTRKKWAWYVALVLAGLSAIMYLLGILSGDIVGSLVGLLVAGVVVWYLLKPNVQAWFGVRYNTPWAYPSGA